VKLLLAALACALIVALALLGGFGSPRSAVDAPRPESVVSAPSAGVAELEPGEARGADELATEPVPEIGRVELAPPASAARALAQGVHGSLRGPAGVLAKARLELRTREREPIASGASDASGLFTLAVPEPVSGAVLRIEAPGCAPLVIAPLAIARGKSLELGELELDAGITLAGRVLDAQGRAVAGAALELAQLSVPAGAEPHARGTSSPSGEFRFEHVPRSRWRIEARATGLGARALEGEVAEASEQLELVLADPRQLELHVVDETGAALSSAHARLVPLRTELVGVTRYADEHGRIAFDELGGMEWRAQVEADEHRSAQMYVAASMELNGPLRVVLARWPSIHGRVLSQARPALPLRELQLRAHSVDGMGKLSSSSGPWRVQTRADGGFDISGLRPGSYVLEARAAHHACALSDPLTLTESQRLEGIVLALERGHELELELSVAGATLPDAHVLAWSGEPSRRMDGTFGVSRGVPIAAARADETGRAKLHRLSSARLWLSVESTHALPRDFGPYESPDQVPARLELEPAALLELRVFAADGSPAANARVRLERPGDRDFVQRFQLDPHGACELARLAPGAWTANVHGACDGTAMSRFELVGGERLELELQLR